MGRGRVAGTEPELRETREEEKLSICTFIAVSVGLGFLRS
jgi:hypothetical protein